MSIVHITSEDYQNLILEVGKARERGNGALKEIDDLREQLRETRAALDAMTQERKLLRDSLRRIADGVIHARSCPTRQDEWKRCNCGLDETKAKIEAALARDRKSVV